MFPNGSPANVQFRAGDGESNQVTISYEPGTAQPVMITDTGAPVSCRDAGQQCQPGTQSGCTQIDANSVRCDDPNPGYVGVELGDLDDSVSWASAATPTLWVGGDGTGRAGVFEPSGGAGNDQISGSGGPDVLYDGSGNDTVEGGLGGDTYYGEFDSGTDQVRTGPGDDGLRNGAGVDTLDGGEGNDIFTVDNGHSLDTSSSISFVGGEGNDRLDALPVGGSYAFDAGPGNDSLNFDMISVFVPAKPGSYSFNGGPGSDSSGVLTGGCCDDQISLTLDGGAGGDSLRGGPGPDSVSGGEGDDPSVSGSGGSDEIDGGAGNDTAAGGGDEDVVHGSDGDDVVVGGAGSDSLFGEAGHDVLDAAVPKPLPTFSSTDFESSPTRDALSCGDGEDSAAVDPVDTVPADCEGLGSGVRCLPDVAAKCNGEIVLDIALPSSADARARIELKSRRLEIGRKSFKL